MGAAVQAMAPSALDQGPLWAVIPTIFFVGPLALLVPAVLGGLALWLRRWLAFLSVASLCSALFAAGDSFQRLQYALELPVSRLATNVIHMLGDQDAHIESIS